MGLFSPGKMRFFSPRKKKAVLEEEEPVSASPLGDASTHAAYAAYESSFPRRDRRDVAPVVLHVAVASPAPPSPARAEASRDVGATTADERRDRDAESDALSEAGRDARETRGHGQTEVADSFVSRSARGVVDAEGVDDTAKRLRLEAFPRSLLSCAVADREKGWIFPSASLWARNPSATHAARFRVRAMRHEEVYVVPNRGVLPPGGCLELRVTPRPVADLAEDPDTVENGDAPPEPNALALVTVAATRASADAAANDATSDDDEPFDDDVDPGLDADAVRTVVEMRFDVTAARECARAVAALELAAELEARNAGTPSETPSEMSEDASEDEDASSVAAAERDAARAEAAAAKEECSRARREADAHAAAAATASDAAGAAAERLARREAEWEAEKATFVSEARKTSFAKVETSKKEEKESLEARVAAELAKRRKVLDAVLDAMRTRAESAEKRAVEASEAVREALARAASVEAELKLDRETFTRRLQSSRAARDLAFDKLRRTRRTAFARTALASWRRVATAAADSRRALETERLVGECAAFAAERDSLEASLAEARRALERPDRDEAGASVGTTTLARDVETRSMRSLSKANALIPDTRRRDDATATPPRDATCETPSEKATIEDGDDRSGTRRVDVEVVVDVDAFGLEPPRVVSETVRRVRVVSPASLFARTRDAHRDTRAIGDARVSGDASETRSAETRYRSKTARARGGGGARAPAETALAARLRVAGDAARRAREPWRPPGGWSPERGARECE